MVDCRKVHDRLARVFDKEIFFIVGLTRSGTTWLQHALDAHPEVRCNGEGHFTDALYPLLRSALGQYNRRSEQMSARLEAIGIQAAAATFTQGDLDFAFAALIGLVLSRGAEDSQIRCIGEKTPEHALALDLLDGAMPWAKYIHVIRDGRDEAVAAWDFNMRINPDLFSRSYPSFAAFAEVFAQNWNSCVGKARVFGRSNQERYFEVRYEDLYGEPMPVIRDMCRFLSLDDTDEKLRRCIDKADGAVPPDGGNEHWKGRFDEEALRRFQRNAGQLLMLLEYAD